MDPVWLGKMSHVVLEGPGDTLCGNVCLGRLNSELFPQLCMCSWWLQVDQNSMDGGEDGVLSCSVWWGVQWGACKSQATAAFMSTVFAPSLDRLDWRAGWLLLTLAHRRAAAYTSAPESTPQSWGPSPWCLLLVFNLSRTKSFICPPTQHATELWSTCWCSWKGTRMRKRRSVCLTLSQWFQTPPSITVCPEQPPSACHSTTELWALQVGCWWINGHRRAKRVTVEIETMWMHVYMKWGPDVEKYSERKVPESKRT